MGDHGVGIGGLADSRENFTTSRFNLYAPYTFEEEVVETVEMEYYPQPVQLTYDGDVPIVIDIPPESERYTKLKTLKLHGCIKVENVTTDSEPLAAEVWSLCNNYIHSLFSNIACKIGEHEIVDSSRHPHPYKAILENLLVPTKFYSETVMCSDGFVKDVDQTAALSSASFAARRKDIARGGIKGKLYYL